MIPGEATVRGSLDRAIVGRIVRRHLNEVRYCYEQELARRPTLKGRASITFTIAPSGYVVTSLLQSSTLRKARVERCLVEAVRRWDFPRPIGGSVVVVTYPFTFAPSGGVAPAVAAPKPPTLTNWHEGPAPVLNSLSKPKAPTPYAGKLLEVMNLLDRKDVAAAGILARRWRDDDPGDVLALVALGETLERQGNATEAARAYGSLIDLFPSRADVRRFAGERLERLGPAAHPLVLDTYERAVAQRPDHPHGHRLFALALLRAGQHEKAFTALEAGLGRTYPPGRFAGFEQVLREDLAIAGAVWAKAEPLREKEIQARLETRGTQIDRHSSTRFVLVWETDSNDVDFHIYDGLGDHASFQRRELASGGQLYADVTTGYGPECFTIPGAPQAFPYRLEAHYYARGPMGYGMGKLEILQHDGAGGLKAEQRPFLVMNDNAYLDLGTVDRALH